MLTPEQSLASEYVPNLQSTGKGMVLMLGSISCLRCSALGLSLKTSSQTSLSKRPGAAKAPGASPITVASEHKKLASGAFPLAPHGVLTRPQEAMGQWLAPWGPQDLLKFACSSLQYLIAP